MTDMVSVLERHGGPGPRSSYCSVGLVTLKEFVVQGALARLKLYPASEQEVLSDSETSISPKGRTIGFPRSSLSVCHTPPGEYSPQNL